MSEEIPKHLLERLSEFVNARMGLHFPQDRWRELERNIKSASLQFGFKNTAKCIEWLLSSELTRSEIEILASYLTVGETYFFREKKIFEILEEQILPEWRTRRESGKRIRIWSAGCCSGEEPYSLAIFLSQKIPDWRDWNITILATDINPDFLRKASEGVYSEWSFRDTPAWIKQSYFKELSHHQYEILPQFKQMVTFSYLNLVDDVYPSLLNNTNGMDLIFCRNVLMYFSQPQAQKVIGQLHNTLVDGGWLVVSATETSPVLYREFASVTFNGFTIYKREFHLRQVPITSSQREKSQAAESVAPKSPQAGLVREEEPAINFAKPIEKQPVIREKEKPNYYESALAQYQAGDYGEAVNALLASDSVEPLKAGAALLLARAYANQGRLPDALKWCDAAIRIKKMDPELHYLRATILEEQRSFPASATAFKQALYLDPDFVLAHFALGNLALRQGNSPAADKSFENALSILNRYAPNEILPGSEGLTSGRLAEIIRATRQQETLA